MSIKSITRFDTKREFFLENSLKRYKDAAKAVRYYKTRIVFLIFFVFQQGGYNYDFMHWCFKAYTGKYSIYNFTQLHEHVSKNKITFGT